jgi:hypothetical protein
MTTSDEQPRDNTGKIVGGIGIGIGVLVAMFLFCILVACGTVVLLALLGPAIGNVFSNIILEI